MLAPVPGSRIGPSVNCARTVFVPVRSQSAILTT
jgi:hypothetical protein